MSESINSNYKFNVLRGATTSTGNSVKEIENAVVELIDELISRNSLKSKDLLSIIFTVTSDLDACYPASVARKCKGLNNVAFLDCQQMYIPNDIDYCIRLMAYVSLPEDVNISHPYLRGASKLRADRC